MSVATDLYIDFIKIFKDDVKFKDEVKIEGALIDGANVCLTLSPDLVQILFNSIIDKYIEMKLKQ